MTNPSPVIFAGVLASKIRKIKIKIQSQRDEASQRFVKLNIILRFHCTRFSTHVAPVYWILTAVGRFI